MFFSASVRSIDLFTIRTREISAMIDVVIPSEVENGAAREAVTWTGRPEAEPTGSERIKPRSKTQGNFMGSFAPLRMTALCVFVGQAHRLPSLPNDKETRGRRCACPTI